MQWARAVTAALVLAVGAPLVVSAQGVRQAGRIVDRTGAPVAGARIAIVSGGKGSAATSSVTDLDGQFVIAAPPAAEVVVDKPGFASQRLRLDPAVPDPIVLDVAPLTEAVRVTSPVLDATTHDAFAATTTIVSATQIEQLNALDLASALRRTPGVTISRFNPVGAFGGEAGGAVFIRGLGASRPGSEIKAYVDGLPVYMGIWGHPLLDLLPLSAVDRIEVRKGPQPQSFGNAFSAIDLATIRPSSEDVAGSVRVSAGAFATFAEQADARGRLGRWDFAVAQGFARSDGHREAADGRIANAFGRVGYQWSPRWSMVGTILVADNDASDPGVAGDPGTRTGRFGTSGTLVGLTVSHEHGRARGSLQAYVNRGEGDWRGQPAPDGDTRTRFALSGVRWREQASWLGASLSGGVDVDRIDGSVQFDRVAPSPRTRFEADALTLAAPHLAVDRIFDVGHGWTLQPSVGVRGYAHNVFESTLAPHAGLVARAAAGLSLRARYARGISYPGQEVVALSGLIPPLRDTWRSLDPERVDHVEAGASYAPSAGTSVDVAWFRDEVSNRYVFAFPPVVSAPTFTNLGRYDVDGLEASVRQRVAAGWQAFVGLTVLRASERGLPYVPERSVSAGVTGGIGAVRVAADVQHQSSMTVLARSRTAGAPNTSRVDGFTVVNVRPSWVVPAWQQRAEVFVAVENLFDESYAYRPGYPMPGASAQVGVTIRGLFR
ncbi:MAG TPA: TonB-dependent receptor [Luteitalea sp.]|nr:TonB-dependent receptor [Luteitalea sp.]